MLLTHDKSYAWLSTEAYIDCVSGPPKWQNALSTFVLQAVDMDIDVAAERLTILSFREIFMILGLNPQRKTLP